MKHTLTRAAVLMVMMGATALFLANARRSEVPVTRASFNAFPMTLGNWHATVDPPLSEDILRVLGVDDYLARVYRRQDRAAVGLYMGFYGSQRQGDTIHSPLNCLPGAGWEPVRQGRLTIANADGAGRDITVNRYVVQKGLERQLVLYWYQSHGRVIAREYTSKIFMVYDAMRLNRTDGAMVRVITPIIGESSEATAAATERTSSFVKTMFPQLARVLPS